MVLSANKLLFYFYFVQGMPYGLQAYYLPLYFHSILHLSITQITLANFLSFPWLIKFIWGPFVDSLRTKRFWLIGTNLSLTIACLYSVFAAYHGLWGQLVTLFIINLLASIQDVVVDSLAVNLLSHEQLTKAGLLQIVAYKLGAVFAGGLGSYFLDYLRWSEIMFSMAVFYFIAVKLSVYSERLITGENAELRESTQDPQCNTYKMTFILRNVIDSFLNSQSLWLLLLLIVYKLGEQGMTRICPLYMLDMGTETRLVSLYMNVVAGGLSIVGSVLGGLLVACGSTSSATSWLSFLFVFRSISALNLFFFIFYHDPSDGPSELFLICVIGTYLLLTLLGGMVTTLTCTSTMQVTKRQPLCFRATHLSLFSTIEILGKLTFISSTGYFTDLFGYTGVFALFCLLDLLSLPIVRKIDD